MMKKLAILALIGLCNIGYADLNPAAAPQKKIRYVTLGEREIAIIKKADKLGKASGVEAPLVSKYVKEVQQGNLTLPREERNALMNEADVQFSRQSKKPL